jgi:hypothetical protein
MATMALLATQDAERTQPAMATMALLAMQDAEQTPAGNGYDGIARDAGCGANLSRQWPRWHCPRRRMRSEPQPAMATMALPA